LEWQHLHLLDGLEHRHNDRPMHRADIRDDGSDGMHEQWRYMERRLLQLPVAGDLERRDL